MWPVMRCLYWNKANERTTGSLAEASPQRPGPGTTGQRQCFLAQACYYASQAAEKAFKGALLELGVEPPHTYVLNDLVQRLGRSGVDVSSMEALPLRGLSRMAIQSLYPVDATPPSELFDRVDAEQAIKTAQKVLGHVELFDQ